jgi:hypothetical protein
MNIYLSDMFLFHITVRPRFWQLVGAAKMCRQNRDLQKCDNQRKTP